MLILTPFGRGIGFFPTLDMVPYQIWQRISPPTPSLRAAVPVMTPFGVVRMLIPKPPRMRGISLLPTYTRQPGRDTRSIREMTGRLEGMYFRYKRMNFLEPSSVSL